MFGGRQPRQTLKINTYPSREEAVLRDPLRPDSQLSKYRECRGRCCCMLPQRTVAPIRPTAVLWSKYLPDVEENFPVVLARGEGGVTALVPGGAPTAIFGDPLPPANHENTKTNEHVITLLNLTTDTPRGGIIPCKIAHFRVCHEYTRPKRVKTKKLSARAKSAQTAAYRPLSQRGGQPNRSTNHDKRAPESGHQPRQAARPL